MSLQEFWTERHLCTLTTFGPDGMPHVVPVGATYDPLTGIARVITSGGSQKAVNVRRDPRVALCQVDGRRWSTLQGLAAVDTNDEVRHDAERRYAERYKPPRVNPQRVVIMVTVTRVLGTYRPA